MPAYSVHAVFALALLCSYSATQEPEHNTVDADQPQKTALASGVDRITGLETTSNIHYVAWSSQDHFTLLLPQTLLRFCPVPP